MEQSEKYALTADVAEYASMHGIPYSAAIGVLVLVGWDGLKRILKRKGGAT